MRDIVNTWRSLGRSSLHPQSVPTVTGPGLLGAWAWFHP